MSGMVFFFCLLGHAFVPEETMKNEQCSSIVLDLEDKKEHLNTRTTAYGYTRETVCEEIRRHPPELLNPGRQKVDEEFALLYRAGQILFGHWVGALEAAGIDPVAVYLRTPFTRSKGTLETLIKGIQSIPTDERSSRAVQDSLQFRKYHSLAQRLLPGGNSWETALRLAGSNPKTVRKKTRPCSAEEIIAYIHERKKQGLSLQFKELRKATQGRRCYKAANSRIWRDTWLSEYVGWTGAVDEAGYDPDEEGIMVMFSSAKPKRKAN